MIVRSRMDCRRRLSTQRNAVPRVANELRFADMPPVRIVAELADAGVYLANRASNACCTHTVRRVTASRHARASCKPPVDGARGQAAAPAQRLGHGVPAGLGARALVLPVPDPIDVYSRKIVSFEVHDTDDLGHAAHLVKRTALAEGHSRNETQTRASWGQRRNAEGYRGVGDAVQD
jgi:hypothetical protein